MTSGQTASLIFSLLCLVLVASSLISRRIPLGQTVKYALAWVAIFSLGLVLFSFRDQAGRAWAEVKRQVSPSTPVEAGGEVRILRDEDGHFSVNAMVNGSSTRFLIDTGATGTVLSRGAAQVAGVDVDDGGFPVAVQTANGMVFNRRARIERLQVGSIAREGFPVLVSDADEMNLLGMNFLSSLTSWRVEGRELILKP